MCGYAAKKKFYDKLVTKVNDIDTKMSNNNGVTKLQQGLDKQNLAKKIEEIGYLALLVQLLLLLSIQKPPKLKAK